MRLFKYLLYHSVHSEMNHFHKLETGNYSNRKQAWSNKNTLDTLLLRFIPRRCIHRNTTMTSRAHVIQKITWISFIATHRTRPHVNKMTNVINNLQLSVEVPTICIALFIKVEVMACLLWRVSLTIVWLLTEITWCTLMIMWYTVIYIHDERCTNTTFNTVSTYLSFCKHKITRHTYKIPHHLSLKAIYLVYFLPILTFLIPLVSLIPILVLVHLYSWSCDTEFWSCDTDSQSCVTSHHLCWEMVWYRRDSKSR